jgi:hypothetical protein
MHLVMGAASTIFLIGAIISGGAAFELRFRFYSIGTIVVMLGSGYFMSLDVPRVAAGEATPYLGLTERLMMAAWLMWMAVFSATLLRRQRVRQV